MAIDNILRTYGDSSAKEDVVLNAIEILTATEDNITNMLGKTAAISTVHSFLTDTLRTVAANNVGEAEDYSALAASTPTRLTNLIQHTVLPFKVSRTQQQISHYHGEDELTRQTNKALKDFANSVEYALVRSTLVSGASGTAPALSGIIEATSKSTNHTSHTSGTAFSASILNGLMRLNWENSNGDVATDLFMGSYLRSVVDGFTQKTNTFVSGNATTIVNTVSAYQTAFGTVSVHTHRYVQLAADATSRILAIRPEKLKVAYLKKPYVDTDLARSGNYENRAIASSWTLEVRNQDSNWYADGFAKA